MYSIVAYYNRNVTVCSLYYTLCYLFYLIQAVCSLSFIDTNNQNNNFKLLNNKYCFVASFSLTKGVCIYEANYKSVGSKTCKFRNVEECAE